MKQLLCRLKLLNLRIVKIGSMLLALLSLIYLEDSNPSTCSMGCNTSMGIQPIKELTSSIHAETKEQKVRSLYLQAIRQFIATVEVMGKIDTLFIHNRKNQQPDDFPDIQLPSHIKGCALVLLDQGSAHLRAQRFCKFSPLINIIGMEKKDEFECIFVAFYPGFQHAYDVNMKFLLDKKSGEYSLSTTRIEIMAYNAKGEADHLEVYVDGNFKGNQALPVLK